MAKQFTRSLNESGDFEEEFDAKAGARIMAIKDSTSMMEVVSGYFGTLSTEAEFMKKMATTKIPKEFLKKMWADGTADKEAEPEAPGTGFWSKFWNVFK